MSLFRVTRVLLLLTLPGWLAATPAAAQPTPVPATSLATTTDSAVAGLIDEARQLQLHYKDSEALAKYEQALAQAPATYEALWQAAVLSVHIGSRYSDETRKAAYFAAARLYAARALVVQPGGGEGSYAEALALHHQGMLLTARARLLIYREMKPNLLRAVEQCPDFAAAWQLLGRWHYRVDHYNVLERLFSRFFLGGMPSGASTRAAIAALTKAHELDPKRIQVCYDLARVQLNQRHHRQAVAALQEAVALTPITAEELEISRRCHLLLVQLNRHLVRQLHHRIQAIE